jgi:hypothetical protein
MESLRFEVEPFGIHTTIVEPGFFRTELLTADSTAYAELSIDDYAERTAQTRPAWESMSGKQTNDPAKLAKALLGLVDQEHPPLRCVGSHGPVSPRKLCARRGGLLEEPVGFGESWFVAHRVEQLLRLTERHLRVGVVEREQATATAEQGVGTFGDVSERLPSCGCLCVEGLGSGVFAAVLGELGSCGAESVSVERVA